MKVFLAIRLFEETESGMNLRLDYLDFSPMIIPQPMFLTAIVKEIDNVRLIANTVLGESHRELL